MKKKEVAGIPLYLTAVGLPLVTYFCFLPTPYTEYPWFPNQDTWLDVFLYGKSVAFVGISLVMLLCLLCAFVRSRKKRKELGKDMYLQKTGSAEKTLWKKWMLPGLLAVLWILSACFSKYPATSFAGSLGQYESLWVLLAYLVTAVYGYWYVKTTGNMEKAARALLLGMLVPCFLGLTQLLQCDFWSTSLGKGLLVPESMAAYRENLRFNFSTEEWGQVYMAFYNPDYAAIYLVMLLPLLFLWKGTWTKVLGAAAAACLVGTLSKSAWVTAGILLVLAVLCVRKSLGSGKKWVYGAAAALLCVILAGTAWMQVRKTKPQTDMDKLQGIDEQELAGKLQEVIPKTEAVKIVYNDTTIYLTHVRDEIGNIKHDIRYEDGTKVVLNWVEELGEMEPEAENLQGLHFKVYEKDGISYVAFRYNNITFRFTDSLGTGKYEYVTINGKVDDLERAEAIFVGNEELLSGRGYIWNRSLPVILAHPLLGTGPDTFLLAFPQDDYVARANLGYSFFTEILTNAHSLYLQMALQTGLPALLCFLVMTALYLKKSWKLYWGKKTYSQQERIGLAFALGVLGYLLCGLTWASSVCTSPVFWLLLGCGSAVNEKVNMG